MYGTSLVTLRCIRVDALLNGLPGPPRPRRPPSIRKKNNVFEFWPVKRVISMNPETPVTATITGTVRTPSAV
jgi:hypothetical protein